jgi:hypothetical protein
MRAPICIGLPGNCVPCQKCCPSSHKDLKTTPPDKADKGPPAEEMQIAVERIDSQEQIHKRQERKGETGLGNDKSPSGSKHPKDFPQHVLGMGKMVDGRRHGNHIKGPVRPG